MTVHTLTIKHAAENKRGVGERLSSQSSPPHPPSFLQQGHTTKASPNGATNFGASIHMSETMGAFIAQTVTLPKLLLILVLSWQQKADLDSVCLVILLVTQVEFGF